MNEYSEPVVFDHPIEGECECGHHYVLNPADVEALLAQRRFNCGLCHRKRLPIKSLVAATFNESGGLAGICSNCEKT